MLQTAESNFRFRCYRTPFLAGKGRRLRSMALLSIGHEFIERDGCFRIELEASQVKTKKRDHFDLPKQLTPYIRHYLNVVRPALLSGRAADPLWISAQGTACTAKALRSQAFTRTQARFGVGFGPHRFRHAIVRPPCAPRNTSIWAPRHWESHRRSRNRTTISPARLRQHGLLPRPWNVDTGNWCRTPIKGRRRPNCGHV